MNTVKAADQIILPVVRYLVRRRRDEFRVGRLVFSRQSSGLLDALSVVVDSQHPGIGESSGHRDGRLAAAAADIAHIRAFFEFRCQTRNGCQPVLDQEIDITGPEETLDSTGYLFTNF